MIVRIETDYGHRYENVDPEEISKIKGEVVWDENVERYCFAPYRILFQDKYNEKRFNVL